MEEEKYSGINIEKFGRQIRIVPERRYKNSDKASFTQFEFSEAKFLIL